MALVKGNKLVQKKPKINNPKIPKEQDPVWPYLKKNIFQYFGGLTHY
jgi:hypothetical protein